MSDQSQVWLELGETLNVLEFFRPSTEIPSGSNSYYSWTETLRYFSTKMGLLESCNFLP
jgi:hypothetical protein